MLNKVMNYLEEALITCLMGAATIIIFVSVAHRYLSGFSIPYLQDFLLSIWAAGYDAGWMCAPLFCPEVVRATLQLEANLEPHAMIPVGIAAKDPVRRPRRPIDDLIVDWWK